VSARCLAARRNAHSRKILLLPTASNRLNCSHASRSRTSAAPWNHASAPVVSRRLSRVARTFPVLT
jgi:hypothetical protein